MLIGKWANLKANLKIYPQSKGKSMLVIIFCCLPISGCEENRSVQCEEIFQLARSVIQSNSNVSYVNEEQTVEMKSWLQAANRLNQAADNIKALRIDNSKLIEYQHQLATIYRIYSQATYDAVRARENQNLEALESARNDAIKAGEMQQNLVREINTYCLNP